MFGKKKSKVFKKEVIEENLEGMPNDLQASDLDMDRADVAFVMAVNTEIVVTELLKNQVAVMNLLERKGILTKEEIHAELAELSKDPYFVANEESRAENVKLVKDLFGIDLRDLKK